MHLQQNSSMYQECNKGREFTKHTFIFVFSHVNCIRGVQHWNQQINNYVITQKENVKKNIYLYDDIKLDIKNRPLKYGLTKVLANIIVSFTHRHSWSKTPF